MHVISKKALRAFGKRHPDSKIALNRWFELIDKQEFRNFAELRKIFGSADRVGSLIVFNIGGNKYRLIASVDFNRGRVYVRHLLTHAEYDKGRWKK